MQNLQRQNESGDAPGDSFYLLSAAGTMTAIVVKSITKLVRLIYVLDIFPSQPGHRQGHIVIALDF